MYCFCYVWDAVSTFNHLPMMFLSTGFAFWITDWTCCHGPYLHAILRIISRSVSGLATDSPCGVWGRGWTTCLLHGSPLFGSHFKMRVVCKFGVIIHIFIISCLCSRFHVRNQWFFYSVITFSYIKCFVHSYTVDVVFTVSYVNALYQQRLIFVLKACIYLTFRQTYQKRFHLLCIKMVLWLYAWIDEWMADRYRIKKRVDGWVNIYIMWF